jgi:excisionase family DNA binding protein
VDNDEEDPLMTPGEVAALFRVDSKTVGRWARRGQIRSIRTPSGRHLFRRSEVRAVLYPSRGPAA